jgi:hypothetical protein
VVNKDNNEDTNGKNNYGLIFYTTNNLWEDAFLAGRGGDFDDDDEGNNSHKHNEPEQTGHFLHGCQSARRFAGINLQSSLILRGTRCTSL